MAVPGSTSVWNSPSTSPPRTFTAPISVIALSFGEPPVVSRSTTTKVTADRAVPTSSIDTCSYTDGRRAALAREPGRRPGEEGTARTVGRGTDSPGDARRTARAAGPAEPGRARPPHRSPARGKLAGHLAVCRLGGHHPRAGLSR